MLQDPVQAEFFTTENVGGLSHAVVREAIQNALDARLGSLPVGVRFSHIEVDAYQCAPYFEDLRPHLGAVLGDQSAALGTFTVPFLLIEDFNTKGLIGDYTTVVEKDAKENNFFYFWRNVGRSGKSGDSRGRWGLGKSVFAVISGISTFFGITNRPREKELLLMGQSVLKYHKLEGSFHTPYGHYGEYELNHPEFPLPIRDAQHTKAFCDIFMLGRLRPDKQTGALQPWSGLSIVIPLPDPEITRENLMQAVIDQYFYPILTESLYIEIEKSLLRKDRLLAEIDRLPLPDDEKQRYRSLIAFTNWAINLPDTELIPLREPPNPNAAPNWGYEYLTEDELAYVRAQFQETGRIAFKVPVKVQAAQGKSVKATFKVYIERDSTITRAENYFIREGITITGIRTMTQRGLRGMVVVDEKPLTTMLGDAENPAHTEWHKDSLKFKGRYQNGPSTLSFVKNSLKILAAQLTITTHDIDRDLLKDIFSIPDRRQPKLGKRVETPDGKNDDPRKNMPDLEPRKSPVNLHPLQGGVAISSESFDGELPERIVMECAYDVRTGDPFKRYVPADFDFSNGMLHVTGTNIEVQVRQDNRLEFSVTEAPFEVRVTGFDRYRDLKVRLKWNEGLE